MTELPPLIHRIPTILYGVALIFFVGSFALSMVELDTAMGNAEGVGRIMRMSMLRALYQSLLEAVYIASNGVLAHILLAIWANGRTSRVEDLRHD